MHGGIHDWEGPEAQLGANISIYVETLHCNLDKFGSEADNPFYDLVFNCTRTNEGVQWAEFAYLPNENGNPELITNAAFVGRFYFDNKPQVSATAKLPEGHLDYYTVFCRVGNGVKTSEWRVGALSVRDTGVANFLGFATYGFSNDPSDGPHVTGTPTPFFPVLEVDVPPDAGEYRYYRRVNNGPRTLIGQGATSNATTIIEADEQAYIANGGTICYYYQFLDFNGNPGPMTLIDCIDITRTMDLPVPVLNPLESTGTETASPGFEASWFCAPQGIERFEVAVHKDGGSPVTASFSPELRDIEGLGITNFTDVVLEGVTTNLSFMTYMTGRVGANFGLPENPEFLINGSVELGPEYILMVRAVGPNGERGRWSEARRFVWTPAPLAGPDVPWPTRPLPPVEDPFDSRIKARFMLPYSSDLPGDRYQGIYTSGRVGIRIGEIDNKSIGDIAPGKGIFLYTSSTPESLLYTDDDGQTVFPCVLYRYQISSPLYPQVSGDVAQVSVLMENIAYGQNDPANPGKTTLYDPFIRVTHRSQDAVWGIYLVDTHPVMLGANYQYLLVRFGENGEPETIYDAGTVSIPE
ncbi:hypothetical protein EGM51_17190 [Verrucomicrobia bacterium S94]|nr:hypothetical protein EGM51_17190 [Verrucomicrobia bacterium S94]